MIGREVYKLRDIQRYCKTKIYLQPIPSLNDVANTKVDKIMEKIKNTIQEEDLSATMRLVEKRLNDEDFTALDMAAAFLKMALGRGENEETEKPAYGDFGDTGAEEGMVRLFVNIGKKQNVKPGDILGAVAGESGMPGKLVGSIDMYDKYTFVEVPREYAKEVLKAMQNSKIKGKSINIEPANRK